MRLQKNGNLVKWGVNALETMGEIFQNETGEEGDLIDKQRAHGLEKKGKTRTIMPDKEVLAPSWVTLPLRIK